jgi:hypothetical protein
MAMMSFMAFPLLVARTVVKAISMPCLPALAMPGIGAKVVRNGTIVVRDAPQSGLNLVRNNSYQAHATTCVPQGGFVAI